MGKLTGIKVVDLSLFLPGPMLTMMMVDQGAEVWKIEPEAGDPARTQGPFDGGQSVWFRNLNRGKKSVVLDLKDDAGKARLWELIADADVFVEGFRPGVMMRLGFDYQAVAARNTFLRATFATRSRDAWIDWFADKDVAFAPVFDFREAFDQPHIAERGLIVEHERHRTIAPAIRFAGEDWAPKAAPELGADG